MNEMSPAFRQQVQEELSLSLAVFGMCARVRALTLVQSNMLTALSSTYYTLSERFTNGPKDARLTSLFVALRALRGAVTLELEEINARKDESSKDAP